MKGVRTGGVRFGMGILKSAALLLFYLRTTPSWGRRGFLYLYCSMTLPVLAPGKRFTLPRPVGSADAVLLAQLAQRDKAAGRMTAIITADAADAQRLMDEMVFFAPELRCTVFPDWETLPYDTFSPHQDLISERLATLWRISQRDQAQGADVVLVPAQLRNQKARTPRGPPSNQFYFINPRIVGHVCIAGYPAIRDL